MCSRVVWERRAVYRAPRHTRTCRSYAATGCNINAHTATSARTCIWTSLVSSVNGVMRVSCTSGVGQLKISLGALLRVGIEIQCVVCSPATQASQELSIASHHFAICLRDTTAQVRSEWILQQLKQTTAESWWRVAHVSIVWGNCSTYTLVQPELVKQDMSDSGQLLALLLVQGSFCKICSVSATHLCYAIQGSKLALSTTKACSMMLCKSSRVL